MYQSDRCSGSLVSFVKKFVAENRPGAMLPSDDELARHFGVSRITVQRRLSALALTGAIVRIRGKGSFVPATTTDKTPPPAARTESVERLVNHVTAAIAAGELVRGNTLPSFKQMCAFFHIAPATVARAYRILEEKGIVVRVGQYYQVGRFASILRDGSDSDVFLFAPSVEQLEHVLTNEILAMSLLKMEHELFFHGCSVHYNMYDEFDRLLDRWIRLVRFPRGVVLTGYSWGGIVPEDYTFLKPRIERLFRAAGSLRPRVLSISSHFRYPDSRVVSLSATHAATAVNRSLALYLFKNRARRVTLFLDEEHTPAWILINNSRLVPELDHVDPRISICFAIRTSELNGYITRCLDELPEKDFTARLSKYRPYRFDEFVRLMAPVSSLEEMCAQSSLPGTWLFNSDAEAARALAWCRETGIDVPGRVSIISFEKGRACSHLGITCCVPDWDTIGYLMAHILISNIPFRTSRRGFVELPAAIFEKSTFSAADVQHVQ